MTVDELCRMHNNETDRSAFLISGIVQGAQKGIL